MTYTRDSDGDDLRELFEPGRSGEYLRALQTQVDQLNERARRLASRVAKLEDDRQVLRERVAHLRSRGPVRGLLAGLRAMARDESPPSQEEGSSGGSRRVDLPDGVGVIEDISLPDRPPRRSDLTVATLLDDFSRAAFGYEFSCVDVLRDAWREDLPRARPAFLLVESAYNGPRGEWAGAVARFGEPSSELQEVVGWCRDNDVPTVFWNKEDPVNTDWFLATASIFDYIFTVDSNMMAFYRRRFRHDNVGVLPFAAQPAIHFPSEENRPGEVAFAGTYYAEKHDERKRQIEIVLDGARGLGLHIFDRMAGSDDPRFQWPKRFRQHVVGSLTYPQTVEAYRRYKVFLNVNTVTESPTMCSRRVFELAASGAAIVTGPSLAIDRLVPPEAAAVVGDETEARSATERLIKDAAERTRATRAARDWVLSEHTYRHRVDDVLRLTGIEFGT